MGISESFAFNVTNLKKPMPMSSSSAPSNRVRNQPHIYDNSSQEQNQKKSQQAHPFSHIDQKHRNIINVAIASALKRMQSEQDTKAQEQEKKIISSINRYYQQHKNKNLQQVDAENMTEHDYEIILRTLRKHHLFKELFQLMTVERDFFSMFLLTIKKKTFKFRDYIYKQYDPPSNFYIIAQGKLFSELNSMGLKPLMRGDYFGLESIIYDSDQGESVKVKSGTAILYEINREQIAKVHRKICMRSKSEIKQLLEEKIIFFNFLDNKEKQNLLNQTVRSTYSKGEIIFEKDYDANAFFVIKKGFVLIKIPHKKDLILEAGNSFGESSFYQFKGQRVGKAVAYQNNTIIYAIGSKAIFKSLGSKIDCAVLQNLQKWALYRDSVINEMYFAYNYDMDKILDKFKIKKGEKYEILAKKGDKIDKLFMNLRCEINFNKDLLIFNSKTVKNLLQKYLQQKRAQQALKERSLNSDTNKFMMDHEEFQKRYEEDEEDELYEYDIIVTERGNYAEANIEDVLELIIEAIEEPEKHKTERSRINLGVNSIQKYAKLSSTHTSSTILAVERHFNIETIIKIYHKQKHHKQPFFTKTVPLGSNKSNQSHSLLSQKQISSIYNQKQIMQNLNHPNICGFYKAQQDDHNIYLVLQYIKGVTLFEVQRELGIMPERIIKFYTLKLATILDQLHSKNVVYRHLTLDNVLIDNKGFPNIFDFKHAKILTESDNLRTSTLVGTPHYLPPEMIQNKVYTFSVDYWQLGVILYQLIYEKLPFADQKTDPMEIFEVILQKEPEFKKENSASVLSRLLEKDPNLRIQNFQEMIQESYFLNYDWELIQTQKMVPPYVPKHKTKRFKNIEVFVKNQNFSP